MKTSRRPGKNTSDTGQGSGKSRQTRCSRCGQSPNQGIEVCPAEDGIYKKCGKKGHFQQTCRSKKKILSINKSSEQPDKSFSLGVVSDSKEPSSVTLGLNDQSTNYCIDTRAEVTVILEKDCTKIGSPE